MLENNKSMDQAKYWICSKRRWINPRAQPSFFASPYATHHESSWEEQAFAEDTLHIWPPRSYSCSFCRREFRSAQALGGHMNVHRRDRAKLRQQPSSPTTEDHEQYNSFAQLEEDVSNPNYVISAYNFYSPPQNQVFLLGPNSNIGDGNSKRKNCSFDDCQEVISRKRQYVDPEFHLFVRAKSPGEVQKLQREVTTLNPSYPIEEIDLELRLGNSPKVN